LIEIDFVSSSARSAIPHLEIQAKCFDGSKHERDVGGSLSSLEVDDPLSANADELSKARLCEKLPRALVSY